MIEVRSNKPQPWLLSHGAMPQAAAPQARATRHDSDEDDWAEDVQRWYDQRAQGVDVAQLLPYHRQADLPR